MDLSRWSSVDACSPQEQDLVLANHIDGFGEFPVISKENKAGTIMVFQED